MASPQLETGFTRISNELLDVVIRTPFIATHLKIVLVCWRYMYGFSRKQAELSESFISRATGISKRYISRELKVLIDANVIKVVKEPTYSSPRIISFNKNYEQWRYRTTVPQVNCNSTVEAGQDTTVEPQFNTTVELQFHQETKTLKKIKKDDLERFFESIWSLYPFKRGKGQIKEAKIRNLYDIGYEQLKRCIQRYKEAKPDWQQWQYGSTFFNSGYVDYLDENYESGQATGAESTDNAEISDPGFLEYCRSVSGGGSNNE